MKKYYLYGLVVFTLSMACNQPTSSEKPVESKDTAVAATTTPNLPPQDTQPAPKIQEIATPSGKVIVVEETHPVGMSVSNIRISFKDDPASAFVMEDKDPVNKILSGDLDADGFGEVYIITTSAGSGSYGNVIGYASLRDKSLGMISIPEVTEKDMAKGGQFEGYAGHDKFEIIENSLARQFPVKDPKGTTRAINYKLKKGEASYQLYIKTSTLF